MIGPWGLAVLVVGRGQPSPPRPGTAIWRGEMSDAPPRDMLRGS